MARLLVENDWFEPLLPDTLVDTFYEDLLLSRAGVLFPGFLAVRHHCFMSNDRGTATPHLALIDRHYRSWWLVLLQAGKSPPASFFLDQAEIVRAHLYQLEDARILADRNQNLDETKLERLMKNESPKLYVILHHPPAPSLTNADIRIGVAELFRSSGGREILRINGEHPRQSEDRLGICIRDPVVKKLLRLTPREGAALDSATRWEIEVQGALTTWTVRRQDNEILLVAPAVVSLPVDVELFALMRSDDGRLQMIPHTN